MFEIGSKVTSRTQATITFKFNINQSISVSLSIDFNIYISINPKNLLVIVAAVHQEIFLGFKRPTDLPEVWRNAE